MCAASFGRLSPGGLSLDIVNLGETKEREGALYFGVSSAGHFSRLSPQKTLAASEKFGRTQSTDD
jgi:hypothetical protein